MMLLKGPDHRPEHQGCRSSANKCADVGKSCYSLLCPLQVDLTILVLDVNDNAPVFQRRDYAVTVPEDVAVGTEVIRVLATSADIGPNAEITYRIRSGNELRKFNINRNLGELWSWVRVRVTTSIAECKIKASDCTMCACMCFRLHFCG